MATNDFVDATKQVLNVSGDVASNMTPRKLAPWLPSAGYVTGAAAGSVVPGVGTVLGGVAGAGLGQIGARMAGLAYGDINPADAESPLKEGALAAGQAASGALDLPVAGKYSPLAVEAALELGETKLTNWLGQGQAPFISRVTVSDKSKQ